VTNAPHRHFTASLAFALRGSFRVRFARGPWRTVRGVLVAPNAQQQMSAVGGRIVILQIDPETSAFAHVNGILAARGPAWVLPPALVARLRTGTEALLERPDFSPGELWDFVLTQVNGLGRAPLRLDTRVARILKVLKRDVASRPTVTALAATVGLSPSRLVHLFNQQLGVSLRRYVLWLRLRQVIFCLATGRSLTRASHEAGFADSAHLCRTFRSMFGLSLSSLFQSPRVEMVVTLPDAPLAGPHAPYDRERWALVSRDRRQAWRANPTTVPSALAGS
jgi:AraC-like DNA-binding protein